MQVCNTGECCATITGDVDACCTEALVFCGSVHGGKSRRLETKKRITFGEEEKGVAVAHRMLVFQVDKVGSWWGP